MITRLAEYKKLEGLFGQSGNGLYIMYGRSGCGMDVLLQLFAKDKKCFYYHARNASAKEQLALMQKEIEEKYQVTLSKDNYDECFNRIKSGDSSKLLLIIDDVDRIIKKDATFLESILKLKGKRLYPGPVMILLCHSSLTWASKGMAEDFGAAFAKVDETIALSDVGFLDVVRAFPEYSVAQCVETYGILGGVCDYLNRWNGKKTIKENVCNHILKAQGFLFEEAEGFIGSELRELSVYNTILASIASGHDKLNDLFLDTGYSRAKISVYMKNLGAFGVVKKVSSFETGGWENTKKGVYKIANHFVNFWFTFVYPNLSDLYLLSPEEFYEKHIEKDLDTYLQPYFADVCREYLLLLNQVGKLPIRLAKIGTWVGKEGGIDIIGQNSARENIVGLCNWKEEKFSYTDYEELLVQMKKAKIKAEMIFLFSAKDFDEKLKELAKQEQKIVLVDMTEL